MICRRFCIIGLTALLATGVLGEEKPFVATPLTKPGDFTDGVEGPACDAEGNIYAVSFQKAENIGKVSPKGAAELFVTLPGKSAGNGIVFDQQGRMYVADYVGHNVLRIDMRTRNIEVLAHDDAMHQPNDLAIAPNDTIYASDPDWNASKGQIWMLTTDGKLRNVAHNLGTTNGIEVSPDGKWLYVNESIQRNVWKFPIHADGSLGEKQLVKQFPDHGFDGMRCDVDGNLYVTRHGKGTVVVMTPDGKELNEVDVLGKSPTNLCFGGPDGKTVYVTEADQKRIVQFRATRPGAAWQRRQKQ